jgi:hypothetical protein
VSATATIRTAESIREEIAHATAQRDLHQGASKAKFTKAIKKLERELHALEADPPHAEGNCDYAEQPTTETDDRGETESPAGSSKPEPVKPAPTEYRSPTSTSS